MTLLKRTWELLAEDQRSLQTISKETDISLYWLQKFKATPPEDHRPNVVDVQTLYEYLTGRKLEV